MRNVITLLLLLISVSLSAQTDSTATGEVVDAEIVIEKDKKIILPRADKISSPVDVRSFNLDPLKVTYQIVEPNFDFPDYKSEISFIETREPFPIASYQNYVRAGYGNFQSPLFELGAYHQLEDTKVAARVYHESFGSGPIGEKNSASSNSSIDLSATYRNKSLTVTPRLHYDRAGYRFYGNADRLNTGFSGESPEKAGTGTFLLGLNLTGGKESVSYQLNPKFTSTNQSLVDGDNLSKESGVEIEGGFDLKLDKKISARIDLEGYSSNYVAGLDYSRSLFSIRPGISRKTDELTLKAGFTFASGKIDDESESGIYPFVSGLFTLNKKWSVYASYDGGVQWNSLSRLSRENLFLDDSLLIKNTNLASSISGGIKGRPTNGLEVQAGVSLDGYENLPFYVPSESDSSRFILTYDGGTTSKFTFLGKVEATLNSTTLLGVNLELYGYTLDSLEKAWHLPDYAVSLYFSQNIKNKLLLATTVVAQGGIDVPISSVERSTDLDAFIDLNLSATYKLTDRLSAFFQLNNMLGKEYEKFIGYPVRGATFKLGACYRF